METEAQLRTEIANLRRGLEHRDVIGQAKGILMERHQIAADDAFERLRRMSQSANVKLHLVAIVVVATVTDEIRPPGRNGDPSGLRDRWGSRTPLHDRRHRPGRNGI